MQPIDVGSPYAGALDSKFSRAELTAFTKKGNVVPTRLLSFGRTLGLSAVLVICASCSRTVEIQVIPYSWVDRLAARPADCKAPVYREGDTVPTTCSDVGDVFVGDNGSSTDCGLERMLDEVRAQTCVYGADAAQVIRVQEPKFTGSTCYEIRARFLKCVASSEEG